MRTLLTLLTALEIVVFIGALAFYLHWIASSLRRSSASLAKVAFGVRAIESQTAPIGPGVTKINGQLATIAGAIEGVSVLAEQAGAGIAPSDTPTGSSSPRPQPPSKQ